jgi:predicted outer membrane repeat protein
MILAGSAAISHSTLTSNSVTSINGQGGGAVVNGGSVDFSHLTLDGNSADFGGGLSVGFVSSVTVSDSTVSKNTAVRSGGGLQVYLSQGEGIKFTNVTFSGNQANDNGGGIFVNTTGVLNLANATIMGNTADANADGTGQGGGVVVDIVADNAGLLNLQNSIIAGNLDLSPGLFTKAPDCDNTVTSEGYNLIGNLGRALNGNHCVIVGDTTGNKIGGDPNLGPLQDNGGPTLTHALKQGSEAIDAGNPSGCSDYYNLPLNEDQRGAVREGRCDMGAYEFGSLLADQYFPLIVNQ